MTTSEGTTPVEGPVPGIDHRHIFAASAFGLRSEELDGRMVKAIAAAEEEDRRRGFIRVDTNRPQLANALGIAFYEGYHRKPLADKEWAGATALHYKYAAAGLNAVAVLQSMRSGEELAAVNTPQEMTLPDSDEDTGDTGDAVDLTESALVELLDGLAAGRPENGWATEGERAEMDEWGIFDPEKPFEGTQPVIDEPAARLAATHTGVTVCRRTNVYNGCIVSYGDWQEA